MHPRTQNIGSVSSCSLFKYENLFSAEPLSTVRINARKLVLIVYVNFNIPVKDHCNLLTSVILNLYVSLVMQDELVLDLFS